MFNQIEFGKRLKNNRKAKNLTQNEVATRIGVSEQAVSKWENGDCLPDVYNLKMLCRLLHISIDSLLDDDNNEQVIEPIMPITDIHLSINFWIHGAQRGIGFMRETTNENQPKELDVFKMPASLFVRVYTDKATANLLTKDKCEIWELFAYIRNYFMPTHGYKMAENGAQEMEVFDTTEHMTGYAYMPVLKI